MSGSWIIELAYQEWHELDKDEQQVFEVWLEGATGQDLYLLVRHAKAHRHSSTFQTVKSSYPPTAIEEEGEED